MNSTLGKILAAFGVVAAIGGGLWFAGQEPEEVTPEVVVAEEAVVVPEPVVEPEPVAEPEPEPEMVEEVVHEVVEPEVVEEVVEEPAVEEMAEPETVVIEEPVVMDEPEVVVVEPEPVEEVVEPEPVVEPEIVEPEVVEPEPAPEPEVVEPEPVVVAPTPEVIEPEPEIVEPETVPEPAPVEEVEVVEEVETVEITPIAEVTETLGDTEMTLEGDAPEFDVVRVDDTGMAVIAGSAEPNSTVSILSDGEKIGEAVAGPSGQFVAIVQTPDKEDGQAIELESEIDGTLLFSNESIIILPVLNSAAAQSAIEEAPVILRATKDEVVVLQGGIAQLFLDQITVDSISYDVDGEVVLAGRGNPGNKVIVYVDDTAIKQTEISESGSWITKLQGLRAGRYVLRVDEITPDGAVNSRSELPFQRAFPEDVQEAKQAEERGENTHIVQPGNSLWVIALGRYGDGVKYFQIFAANQDQIRDPDLIYPGQVFALPDIEE